MFDQFKAKAEAVSAVVYRFATKDEALGCIVQVLKEEKVDDVPGRFAVWAACPFLEAVDKQQLAGIAGLNLEVSRQLAASAHIGISQVDWALADTGTLVQDATAIDKRLVSTLPFIHIALLPAKNLYPDMPSLLAAIDPQAIGYLAMITGPSRTADIERVLTIGVHGPERLIIIVVDELGGTN